MAEKEPAVSWQVLLDDAHWDGDAPPPAPLENPEPARAFVIPRRWWLLGAGLLLGVVVVGGLIFWQRAQAGLAAVQDEIGAVVLLEATAQAGKNPRLAAALLDPQADAAWRAGIVEAQMKDTSAPATVAVEQMELAEGVALVHLLLTDPDLPQPSRVVRFYREEAAGWLRTPPVADFWGEAEAWEGEHFTIRFRQQDRAAVLGAGPRLEEAYIRLRQSVGLPVLPVRRVVVIAADDQPALLDPHSGELHHPSPALLSLPVGVGPDEALYRSLIAYLISEIVRESFDRYAYGESWMWSNLTESGLRNWLLLEADVLVMERPALFAWLFDAEAQAAWTLPAELAAECQLLNGLAVPPPLFVCTPDIHAGRPSRFSATRLARLITTYDFDFVRDANFNSNPSGPMWRAETRREIAAATTIFSYAVHSYGVERLPHLLAALGDYRTWLEALPGAYGVTPDEFEAGWQRWLAAEYGVEE